MKPFLFLIRHFPPDVGALSFRMQHASEVLAREHPVCVLAAQPNRYRDVSSAPRLEQRGRIKIHRVWHGQLLPGRGKISRGVTEIVGALWMTLVALLFYRRSAVVFVSTPPLFCAFPGWVVHKLCRVPLMVDLRDLWLDWAEEAGVIRSKMLLKLIGRYERSLLTSAKHITVATKSFKEIISERFDIDPQRITVIYNGLDEVLQRDEAADESAPEKKNGVRRVLYAGNMGPSQSLLGIFDGCLDSVRKWPELEIVLVGDGAQWAAMNARQTDRVRVVQRIGREELKALYQSADAFLLHLADLHVYQHTVPSKLFEYVSYQKPILCGVTGEARGLCRQYVDCYEFLSDDPASLGQAVDRFMQGERPDNADSQRSDLRTVLRSARDSLWTQAFAAVGG